MKLVLSTENKRLSVRLSDEECDVLFDSLVLSILHFDPVPKKAESATAHGDVHEETTPYEPDADDGFKPDPQPGQYPEPVEPVDWTRKTEPEPKSQKPYTGYTGFLFIRCPACGKERAFCSKFPITEFTCKECGHRITLPERLSYVNFQCKCGRSFKYRTNIMDPMFEISCLDCGAPNTVFRNPKTGDYDDGSEKRT